jgi:hypothetical protein
MNRQDLIKHRLVAYFRDELHIYGSDIARDDWLSLPLHRMYRFGWIPPIDLEEVEVEDNLIAIISSEMIAAVTEHLADDELDVYLNVIEMTVAAFVQHRGEPAEQIERELENLLWEQVPHAIELRSQVEMHALDVGIVPVCH